jgi:chaperonin GroEL
VDAVADPVKVTLGPRGRKVLIDRPGQPLATRDGVTVAKEVSYLADPFENMGAAYAREVADAAVVESGDGTTTATVIFQKIVRDGNELIDAGAEPLLLADGIAAAAAACEQTIKTLAIPATPELIRQAAIISTHGDIDLGTMIAEATCKVGANGVLELQESRDEHTTIEHVDGFYFERGWRAPNGGNHFFVNDSTGQKCVLRNPYILISERVIVGSGLAGNGQVLDGDGIGSICMACAKERRPLLIIAEDLTGDALHFFVANVTKGTLAGCFIKLPGFGEQRAAAIEDLRVAVGAKRVHSQTSTQQNDQLSSFTVEDLGWCEQAVISPTRTVLLKGGAHPDTLTRRVKQLIDQSQVAENPFEKEQLDHRIARLTGGVAVLRVGAESEPVMLEKKALAEDAIHACRGALQEGVVPGGGVALLRASKAYLDANDLSPRDNETDTRAMGAGVLLAAIEEPLQRIMLNAGKSVENVVQLTHGIKYNLSPSFGFNSATGRAGDLYAMGIVDPAKVVLTALRKAASIGALLLTTEVLVTDRPEPQSQPAMPAGVLRG